MDQVDCKTQHKSILDRELDSDVADVDILITQLECRQRMQGLYIKGVCPQSRSEFESLVKL